MTQATDREADNPSARSFPWRPLLRGDATEPVLAVVDDVARAVSPLMRNEEDPSLAAGAAGGAFLFSALERAGRTHGGLPSSRALLAHAARSANRGRLPPSLWQGTGGVAYALSQLAGCRPEPTLLARFADWTSDVPDSQYDLISGLTGMGVLALELLPDPAAAELLKVVVLRLSASAERGELGITWASSEHLPRTARYDLGTAHGVPGVIGLLAGALRTPSPPTHTRELLEGAVRWTLAQRLAPGAPSALPYSAPGPHAPTPARLAWCYGDAGAAIPLLLAAEALEDEHLREAAHDLARGAAMRRPETAGVVDAGICHGAAGLAHLFGRMWQLTGDDHFAAAGRAWLDRTIELRRPELPVAGFPRLMPERERGPLLPRAESGLLAGAVGVGLMLLAACHDDEPSWDRALLASRLGH